MLFQSESNSLFSYQEYVGNQLVLHPNQNLVLCAFKILTIIMSI